MNIQGGGISFEVSGTNEKLMKILQQSKTAISTFSKESITAGKDIDKGFEQAAQAIQTAFQKVDAVIDENLQAIKELEAQNEKLQAQYAKAFMSGDDKAAASLKAQVQENERIIRARQQIIDQAQPIIQELSEEDKKLQEQKKHVEDNVNSTKSLKAQLRECREQLALMEENGQRGSEAYRKMQQEAGRLTNALGDAQAQAKILSHDNQLLQGTMSAISGIVGGFTAAQGAVALFAGENENLQRVMLKVQSLMSITMGLQQVMNTLNKDSAFQLTIVARAKDMLTAANARLATALGISTAAAQALMATLTLGLSAAITAIVVLLSRMSSESSKAAEQQKKFNEEVAKAAGKPLSAYIALKTEWEQLSTSLKEREKWVQDNADRFESLGLKVYDAKTAEKVLVDFTDDFVRACMAKAKALAAQQLAAEKYEEILKKQAEIEAMPDKTPRPVTSGGSGGPSRTTPALGENADKKKAEEELARMKKEARAFIEQQLAFSKEEQQLLSQMGSASAKVVEGSVEAVEQQIARLQAQYKRAATDAERANLATKIVAKQAKLSKIQLNTKTKGGSDKPKDPYLDMLQKRKTAYSQYSKWVQSEDETVREAASGEFAELLKDGTSYLDYLEKQRASISGKVKKTAADLHKLTVLNNEIAETTKQTVLSDFEAQLNRELQMCNTIGQRLSVIARQRESLSNDNSDVDREKHDILREAEESTLQQAKQETAALLQEYASYTNERIKFEESYARNRELLLKTIHAKEIDGEDAFIAELLKAKAAYAAYAKEITSDDTTVAASAKQRYAELLKGGSTFVEMLRNKIKEIEDRQVKVGVDVSGVKQLSALRAELHAIEDEKALAELRAQLRALEDKQLEVGLDVEGTEQLESLREQIAQIEDRRVKVGLDVEDSKQLTALRAQIRALEDKQLEVGLDVEGTELLKQLRQQVRALEDKEFNVIVNVEGTKRLEDLRRQIDTLEDKILKVADTEQLRDLRQQIKQLEEEKVSVGLDIEGEAKLTQLKNSLRALEDKQIAVALDVEGMEQLKKLRQLLMAENTSDEQIQAAIAAYAALEKRAKELAKQSGNEQYDEMLERYKSYQQQINDIHEKYTEERALAEKNENYEMLAEINKAEQAELSKAAVQRLTESESWVQLFSDLKKLSKDTIRKLIEDINSQRIELSAQFSPADLQAMREQLEKAEQELESRDPFSTLKRSILEIRKALKTEKLISSDDPFVKDLLNKKAQYEKYTNAINSGNKTLAKAVRVEYANLLKEGETYTDFLKRKIEELEKKKISIGLDVDETESLNKLNILLDKEIGAINELNGDNFRKLMDAGRSLAENFRDITDCMSKIADEIGNENLKKAADIIDDVLTNIEASQKGAEAWGGWWGAVIGGVTDLLPKLVKWFNGDKKIEQQIYEHQIAVNSLKNAYNELEHQVKKALGTERYSHQKAEISNLRQQQAILYQMIEAEMSKKSTDWNTIQQYQEQITQAARSIEDIISDITQNITQTSAKDLAGKLADALEEAFGAGEDAAKAFGEVTNSVMREAVKNALKMQFLEKPLQAAIKQLQHDMGFDDEGSGAFDGLTDTEQARFRDAVAKAGANFNEAMKAYQNLFEQLDENDTSTLSGAIKGASQESIDLLAGQANAVRVNQVTSLDILRQQLTRLSTIDANVGVIAGRLLTIVQKLTTPADDGLRGQGITN